MRACLRGKFALKKECQTPQHLVGGRITIKNFAFSPRAREASAEKFNDELLELQANLNNELQTRLLNGDDFPKGTVEAFKVLMQEKARQISWRDDSRYGDRKTVKIQSDTPDLSTIDMEKLKAARELLYDETPDTDRT